LTVYTKWIWLSFFLAAPAAFTMISKLFSRTANHTSLDIWIFVYAGLVVFSIAMIAIGWQVYRAASANPVEALRYE
jgi:putative ABC transport system permease protein